MDVSDEAQVEKGVNSVIGTFGKIDVLVSNAGIQIVKPLHEFPFADWKRLLAIHLDGAFLTTRACLRHMYAARCGSIVYIGSVHSKEAPKLKAPYVTAKHGLLGLCRVVAKEGAEFNVRANVVCPGDVHTPLVDKQIPEQAKVLGISETSVVRDVMLRDTVDGEFTTAADIADAVLYFAGAAKQCADRAVARRQPRVVHGIARRRRLTLPGRDLSARLDEVSSASVELFRNVAGGDMDGTTKSFAGAAPQRAGASRGRAWS